MQLRLPIFPQNTQLISACLGVFEHEGIIQYLINGLPSYCHAKDDLPAFRFITSNYIELGLCTQAEVQRCFQVSIDSVRRWRGKYKQYGEAAFFGEENRKGKSHKIIGERKKRIQKALLVGKSVNSIAKKEGISEGSIRYQIKTGKLKKKKNLTR